MRHYPALTAAQRQELSQVIKKSESADEVRRAQAIIMISNATGAETVQAIESLTGYQRRQAFDLRRNYFNEGIKTVIDKRKGKPKELLSPKQRKEIVEILKTKTPQDLGYAKDHWTTCFLGDWIKKSYNVKYRSRTSFYVIFKQAKFTYHKPGRIYRNHNEKEIRRWRKRIKPKLEEFWLQKDTIILCEDEMILTTETTVQKVWLPQGQYPKIECSNGSRKRKNVYGFLNVKTGQECAFKTDYQTMYVTAQVLKDLRKIYPTQKIVLFWDNAGWHKGSVAQDQIKTDGNIEVVNFPNYAPKENPQEYVWESGRSHCTHNEFIEDIDSATDGLVKYFNETKFKYSLLELSANS